MCNIWKNKNVLKENVTYESKLQRKRTNIRKNKSKQDCIPVGCVPPSCCPISQHALHWGGGGFCSWGVSGPGVVSAPGRGAWSWGVPASGPGGCLPLVPRGVCVTACNGADTPVNIITDTCKNITLPQLRCRRQRSRIGLAQ